MSTRSTIALEFADGTVQQVYCHSDGYLSYNGQMLLKHWSDPFKLRDLIEQGDLSSLGEEVGVKHSFDAPGAYGTLEYLDFKAKYGKMCRFYGRDRQEHGVEPKRFKDMAEYVREHQYEEYEYILTQSKGWLVFAEYELNGKWVPLAQAIEQDKEVA
jgi:hypothetical protein